ncbi:MAG: hypothetical protein NT094_02045 [Candidatus Staskawiczbacteria bacterium]|nr:hypothetical protein [Candidatus Staskawiczbacteria bacterium]
MSATDEESARRQERIQEIVRQVSPVHKDQSEDPAALCMAKMTDYNLNHPDIVNLLALVLEMFGLCLKEKAEWTRAYW